MKRLLVHPLLPCLLLTALLTACGPSEEQVRRNQRAAYRSAFGYQGEETVVDQTQVVPNAPPSGAEAAPMEGTANAETAATAPVSQPTPAPTPAPVVKKESYPYGKPVPGKAGFVTSPYSPESGLVDVRGYPPGTQVKDPYTGKIFLVP
jgi:hypothetical protein